MKQSTTINFDKIPFLPNEMQLEFETDEKGRVVLTPSVFEKLYNVIQEQSEKNQTLTDKKSDNNQEKTEKKPLPTEKKTSVNQKSIENLESGSEQMNWKDYLDKYKFVVNKLSDFKFVQKSSEGKWLNYRKINGRSNAMYRAFNRKYSKDVIFKVAQAMQRQYKQKLKRYAALFAFCLIVLCFVLLYFKAPKMPKMGTFEGFKLAQHTVVKTDTVVMYIRDKHTIQGMQKQLQYQNTVIIQLEDSIIILKEMLLEEQTKNLPEPVMELGDYQVPSSMTNQMRWTPSN